MQMGEWIRHDKDHVCRWGKEAEKTRSDGDG